MPMEGLRSGHPSHHPDPFDASGHQGTFIASGVVLLIGAFLTFRASHAQARQGA